MNLVRTISMYRCMICASGSLQSAGTCIPILSNTDGRGCFLVRNFEVNETEYYGLNSVLISLDGVSERASTPLLVQASEDNEIRYSVQHRIDSESLTRRIVLVGLNSDFGFSVGSVLVVPRSQPVSPGHVVDMIVRPSNPHSFCMDNRITYVETDTVPCPGHRRVDQLLGMYSSVKIVGDDVPLSEDPVNFLLIEVGTTGRSFIPYELWDRLVVIINENNGSILREDGKRYILAPNCFESMISILPQLEISILDSPDLSTSRLILRFTPDEYIEPVQGDSNRCLLLIRPRVRIPDQPYNTLHLDLDFIKRLVIHFDYINQRIGFGDPL